jgi:hypothetical protein
MAKKKSPVKKSPVKKSPVKKKVKNIRAGDQSANSTQTALLANKMLAAKKVVNKNKGVSPAELAYNIAKSQVVSAKTEKDTSASIFEETSARITEHLDSKNQRVDIGYKQTQQYDGDPSQITLMPYCLTYVTLNDIIYDSAGIYDNKSSSVALCRAAKVMKTFLEKSEEDSEDSEVCGTVFFDARDMIQKIEDIQEKMNDIRWEKSFDDTTREEMEILKERVERIPLHILVIIERQHNIHAHRVDVGLWDALYKEQASVLLNRLEKPISEMKLDRGLIDVAYSPH